MGNGGCVDFTNLNQACPKDSFSLPRICRLVKSTTRHELLTFMDAFSRYNQICISKEVQDKTTFITSQGFYCYKMMPFRLKNARATYQRLVNQMFNKKIGRNVEVYVDDMLVKSKRNAKHLDDQRETFDTLQKIQDEAQSSEICLQSMVRKIPRFHGVPKRNRSQS